MAQASNIEWTDTTWNPVVGCSKVSPGCANCYAERMARRLSAIAEAARSRSRNPGRASHYSYVIDARGRWNGNVYLDEEAVNDPLKWRLPRTVFVNSMSDLFHEDVPLEFIVRVFEVMNRCDRHTFQVLTKRPERAAECAGRLGWGHNIWMGTSIENASVVNRLVHLRRIPSAVRFLSLEPLLGPLPDLALDGIHWVIVGGESGPGARPMHECWVADIHEACREAEVPFFFKQWGGVNKAAAGRVFRGAVWDEMPETV